jgi:hypothetical protein
MALILPASWLRPADLSGFRVVVQSGYEAVGKTVAGKIVFEEFISPALINQPVF